jgi:hypothetical protein
MLRYNILVSSLATAPVLLVMALSARATAQSYGLTPLPMPSGATEESVNGITRLGHVAGAFTTTDGSIHPFIWKPGDTSVTPLSFPSKTFHSAVASYLNDSDQVVGIGYPPDGHGGTIGIPAALTWNAAGVLTVLPTRNGNQTEAWGINNAGTICGMCRSPQGRTQSTDTAIWKLVSGKWTLYPVVTNGVWSMSVNNVGQVLHGSANPPVPHLWTPDVPNGTSGSDMLLQDISVPNGGYAGAVNDSGQVAFGGGTLYLPTATLGLPAGYSAIPPIAVSGALRGFGVDGMTNTLNVVGEQWNQIDTKTAYNTLWIWNPTNGTRDLKSLVDSSATGWDIGPFGSGYYHRVSINESGQIAATGLDPSGHYHGYVLTPYNPGPVLFQGVH